MTGIRLAELPVFCPAAEFAFSGCDYKEKRQLFLRSYQFSRKQTAAGRIKGSVVRARRFVSVRLRAARRLVWLRMRPRFSCPGFGRWSFHRLHAVAGRSRVVAPPSWGPFYSGRGCRHRPAAPPS